MAAEEKFIGSAERLIRETGGRMTEARIETLRVLFRADRRLSAAEIEQFLAEDSTLDVDRSTIFRMLKDFVELGIVHRLDSDNTYICCSHIDCSHGNHAVLVCTDCGSFQEVDLPERLFQETRKVCRSKHGFEIAREHVRFAGKCENCG